MHNLDPHRLPALVRASQEAVLSDEARMRLQWIVHFIGSQGSIGDTCARFEISRSTLHRWLERFDPNDLSSLEEGSHAPRSVRQPVVPESVVALIREYRVKWPLIGKEKIAKLLLEQHGVVMSSSSVGRVIERECMYFANTPLHWRKRMEGKRAAPVAEETVSEPGGGFAEIRKSRTWFRMAMAFGFVLQGIVACLALAALWQLSEKPVNAEASVTSVEINQSLPSVTPDE